VEFKGEVDSPIKSGNDGRYESLGLWIETIITPASKYIKVVIVRLDRTIQNLLKRLDSPIKSGNDVLRSFIYLII